MTGFITEFKYTIGIVVTWLGGSAVLFAFQPWWTGAIWLIFWPAYFAAVVLKETRR